MALTDPNTVVGVLPDRDRLEQAIVDLQQAGFDAAQIGYAIHGEAGHEGEIVDPGDTRMAAGTAAGAASGALIGGLVGAAVAGLIPGIGPIVAVGALSATLGTAVGGAVVNGLLGAITGLGFTKEEAQWYEDAFKAGNPLLMVQTSDHRDDAAAIIHRNGGWFMGEQPSETGAERVTGETVAGNASWRDNRPAGTSDNEASGVPSVQNGPPQDQPWSVTTGRYRAEQEQEQDPRPDNA